MTGTGTGASPGVQKNRESVTLFIDKYASPFAPLFRHNDRALSYVNLAQAGCFLFHDL